MKKLRGLFSKKEDIKPKLLSFREFCQYVYEPSQRLKALNLPEDQKKDVEEAINERRSISPLEN